MHSSEQQENSYSSFLNLAPELRTIVYTLVFPDRNLLTPGRDPQPALTQTCRLIRSESPKTHYRSTDVWIVVRWESKRKQWLPEPDLPSAPVLSPVREVSIAFDCGGPQVVLRNKGLRCELMSVRGKPDAKERIEEGLAKGKDENDGRLIASLGLVERIAAFVSPPSGYMAWD